MYISEGNKGSIEKVIELTLLSNNLWNLAFGDKKEDDWEDNIVTNNDDMRKVLQTIANAIHIFLDTYPKSNILIKPLDYRRKLLYNRTFQQKWSEINVLFYVLASISINSEEVIEDYDSTKIYDYFVISRKNDNFEN